ncbi:MAG: PssD/Cps14F family polysaccharide biosynthesis glycosyltransferase [Nanoarchaeota archaeon]
MVKIKLLIHLGLGGHTSQILRLVDLLGPNYKYEYIIGNDDQTSAKKIKFPGKIYKIKNPRLMKDKSLLKVSLNMVPTTIRALKILRKSKPAAIISAGPSSAIPLFWLAKLMGIKTIFIESWVRVHHKSQTGKLVYSVSDLFFVQWKSMKKVYPKAIYAGRLS